MLKNIHKCKMRNKLHKINDSFLQRSCWLTCEKFIIQTKKLCSSLTSGDNHPKKSRILKYLRVSIRYRSYGKGNLWRGGYKAGRLADHEGR